MASPKPGGLGVAVEIQRPLQGVLSLQAGRLSNSLVHLPMPRKACKACLSRILLVLTMCIALNVCSARVHASVEVTCTRSLEGAIPRISKAIAECEQMGQSYSRG